VEKGPTFDHFLDFGAVLFWDFVEVAAKNVQFFSSHRWIWDFFIVPVRTRRT